MTGSTVQHIPFRRVVNRIEQGWSPSCENRVAQLDEWGVLKVGCVNGASFAEGENKALPADLVPLPALEVRRGDLLMSRANTRELVGSIVVVRRTRARLMLSDKLFRIVLKSDRADARYAAWAITSSDARVQIEADATGASSSMQNIGQDTVRRLTLWLPEVGRQRSVADFLDRKAAAIDALIAKKERLIELLQEKRQALITQAVTKGLDPNVPMKDSGIEWLGAIPAHWTVVKLARVAGLLAGFAFPSDTYSEDERDVRLLRGVNVGVGEIRWEDVARWPASNVSGLDRWWLRSGDLVIGLDRPWIRRGLRVAKVTQSDVPALLLQRVARLRCTARLNVDFLHLSLQSPGFQAHVEPETTGVSVPHISPVQVLDFRMPLPPAREQRSIVSTVNAMLHRMRAIEARLKRQLNALAEYRQGLITAAVTGKLDVSPSSATDVTMLGKEAGA